MFRVIYSSIMVIGIEIVVDTKFMDLNWIGFGINRIISLICDM